MWRVTCGFCRDSSFERRGGLAAVVTTRSLGDMQKPGFLAKALRRLGQVGNRWVAGEQVHGVRVRTALKPSAPKRLPATDGFVTRRNDLSLSIRVADCAPVFIADPRRKVLAVVHAGWRGTRAGILRKAVARMKKEFGSRARDLRVAVGPHIRPCCYEIGPDVARFFQKGGIQRRGGKLFLDLAAVLRREARRAGVPAGRISISTHCTAHDERFYSFRRDKTKERQAALAAIL